MSSLDYHTKHTAFHLMGKDQQTGLATGPIGLLLTFHIDISQMQQNPNLIKELD